MYKRLVSSLYVINIVFQSILTLLSPPALFFFINYICISRLSFPKWTYAISITVGFIVGIISMIKFAVSASEGLERLEKQRQNKNQETDV